MASLSPVIQEIVQAGGTAEITVTGNSMYPMLIDHVSQVRLCEPVNICVGDIPLYRRDNGMFVLHRIVCCEGDVYTCCGDNQWRIEAGIRRDQVLAVVTAFKRKKKWHSCQAGWYTLYARLWIAIRPLRRLLFGGVRRVKARFTSK